MNEIYIRIGELTTSRTAIQASKLLQLFNVQRSTLQGHVMPEPYTSESSFSFPTLVLALAGLAPRAFFFFGHIGSILIILSRL